MSWAPTSPTHINVPQECSYSVLPDSVPSSVLVPTSVSLTTPVRDADLRPTRARVLTPVVSRPLFRRDLGGLHVGRRLRNWSRVLCGKPVQPFDSRDTINTATAPPLDDAVGDLRTCRDRSPYGQDHATSSPYLSLSSLWIPSTHVLHPEVPGSGVHTVSPTYRTQLGRTTPKVLGRPTSLPPRPPDTPGSRSYCSRPTPRTDHDRDSPSLYLTGGRRHTCRAPTWRRPHPSPVSLSPFRDVRPLPEVPVAPIPSRSGLVPWNLHPS